MSRLPALVESLRARQRRIAVLLEPVAGDKDWTPDGASWSFRDQAVHLATTQRECVQARIRQIAAGKRPRFDTYLNTRQEFV